MTQIKCDLKSSPFKLKIQFQMPFQHKKIYQKIYSKSDFSDNFSLLKD